MSDQENEIVDITIVGGGPVGLYGAYYAGLRGSSVRIIESLPQLGGRLMALYPEKYIYDVAGFPKIYAKDLINNLTEQAMQYKPFITLDEKVCKLESNEEDKMLTMTTDKGNSFKSKSVIIAAGVGAFVPRKLDVKGVDNLEGSGVYYFVDDLSIFNDKRVLIVGGGDSAVDWALTLEKLAKQVTLLHRLGRFQAHEDSVDKMLNSTVDVKFPYYEIKELHGENKVKAVTYFNSKTGEEQNLEIDALLLNIGFLANLGPLLEWGLDIEKNSIKVNHKMESNLPGVFAAGDIVTHPGKIKLISTGSGEIATAVNIAKAYIDPSAKVQPAHSSHQKKKPPPPKTEKPKEEPIVKKKPDGQSYSGYEIIKSAIEDEKDGIAFYEKIVEKSSNPETKEIFKHLLQEEKKHLIVLKNTLLPAFENGHIDLIDEELIVAYLKRINRSGIFPEDEKLDIIAEDLRTDLEAILIGIEIEKKSIAFYEKTCKATPESEGKKALETIVKEENEHLAMLRKLQAEIMSKKPPQ